MKFVVKTKTRKSTYSVKRKCQASLNTIRRLLVLNNNSRSQKVRLYLKSQILDSWRSTKNRMKMRSITICSHQSAPHLRNSNETSVKRNKSRFALLEMNLRLNYLAFKTVKAWQKVTTTGSSAVPDWKILNPLPSNSNASQFSALVLLSSKLRKITSPVKICGPLPSTCRRI